LSSNVRSEERKIEKLSSFTVEYKKKAEQGFTKPKEQEEYEERFKQIKEEAEKAKDKIEKFKEKFTDNETKSKIVNKLTSDIAQFDSEGEIEEISNQKAKLLTDNLQRLNRNDRKLVGKVLSIIDNILPKELSENVKQKIIEELNK
jgi:molecular chaperone HtpG